LCWRRQSCYLYFTVRLADNPRPPGCKKLKGGDKERGIIPRFAELYVRGFLNGGGYDAIPLERNAYMLGQRYERNPAQHFSVADEVAGWIAEGKF